MLKLCFPNIWTPVVACVRAIANAARSNARATLHTHTHKQVPLAGRVAIRCALVLGCHVARTGTHGHTN